MIGDVISLIQFLEEKSKQIEVLSGLFSPDGVPIRGHRDVQVVVTKNSETCWFYNVEPLKDYMFVRLPLNPEGVMEELAFLNDGTQSADFFRYVQAGRSSASKKPNVRMPFVVKGFPTAALLDR